MNKRLVMKDRLFGVNTRSVEAEGRRRQRPGRVGPGRTCSAPGPWTAQRSAVPAGAPGRLLRGRAFRSHPAPKLPPAAESWAIDHEFVIGSHLPRCPAVQRAAFTALRVDQVYFPGRLLVVLYMFDSQACSYFLFFF